MRPFHKKSRVQRLLGSVSDSLDLPGRVKDRVPSMDSPRAVKSGLAAAGGAAGITAASAVVSSLRRRSKESRHDS